jgi:flagellar hook assembly protein FlgD
VRALVTGASSAGDRTVATPLSPRVSAYGLALAQVAAATTAASPTVTVSWSQSLPATVQIAIEDASGTVVKHLLRSADYAAGSWFVRWARYGDDGAVVPSGSYRVVVTATAGGVSVTTAARLAL